LINDTHTITLGEKTHVFHLEGFEGAMFQILLDKSAQTQGGDPSVQIRLPSFFKMAQAFPSADIVSAPD
jgi:hypothetical protein